MVTDPSPNRLASGTADIASNVILDAGSLKRRKGFAEWEDAVAAQLSVVAMWTAAFGNGYVYVYVKLSNGTLYHRRVYPTEATSFTAITGGATHSGVDVGWGFTWKDRFYHFDRGGGTKHNPAVNSGTAYKAGLPRPAVGPVGYVSAGGEMDGHYHYHVAYRNSVTREESVVTAPQTPATLCRIGQTPDISGITIGNWSDASVAAALALTPSIIIGGGQINEQDSTYEWDQAIFFCTRGNTEWVGKGTTGVESFSYRGYVDEVKDKTDASVGLNKNDECLDQRQPILNCGGEPPKAAVGCLISDRGVGVYGNIYSSACAAYTTAQSELDSNLTLTAILTGTPGNVYGLAYTGGATAGAEVVTVASGEITVKIQSGVSTANQVLAALLASTDVTDIVSVRLKEGESGTGFVVTQAMAYFTGGGTTGNSLSNGKVMFSIPGQPCMVPQRVTYSIGGDRKIFEPQPWIGETGGPVAGEFTAMADGGGITAAFTAQGTYLIRTNLRNGQLLLSLRHPSKGCVTEGAACGTVGGVYALGDESWLHLSEGGSKDIAQNVFASSLAEIPVAYRNQARLAYYSFQGQCWSAVNKSPDQVARRIYVWDEKLGGNLYRFDLAAFTDRGVCTGSNYTGGKTTITATAAKFHVGMIGYVMVAGGANWTITDYTNTTTIKVSGDATTLTGVAFSIDWDEGIASLCELACPGAQPYMLIGTSRGRILRYPETDLDDGAGFTSQWRGYFGQERIADDQRIGRIDLHTGSNCDGEVKVYLLAMQTGYATETQKGPVTLAKDNGVCRPKAEFDRLDGSIFQLDIQSDTTAAAQWEIAEVVMSLTRRNQT
jgi:hypothetical protein